MLRICYRINVIADKTNKYKKSKKKKKKKIIYVYIYKKNTSLRGYDSILCFIFT